MLRDKKRRADTVAQLLASSVPVQERWDLLRSLFIDRVWLGLLAIAIMAVPASMSRSVFTGWKAVYVVHLLFLLGVVSAWLFRKRLSFSTRALLAIALMDVAAVAGVLTFGLLGSAWWWMFMAGLLVGILYSLRAGLIHSIIALFFLSATGLAFINGWLVVGFDANAYVGQYASWLTMLSGPALLTLFIFWAVATYQEATFELLREVDRRQVQGDELILQLQQAMDENKALRGLVPICSHCKKIRHDEGYWESVESFMRRYTAAEFTHAMCHDCGVELYGDLWRSAMEAASKLKPKT